MKNKMLVQILSACIFSLILLMPLFAGGEQEAKKVEKITVESTERAKGEIVKLKLATVFSVDHPYGEAVKEIQNMIEWRSNGEIQLEYYPAAQLGTNREIHEAVMTGDIDMTIGGAHYVSSYYPEFGITVGPYIFRDFNHAFKVLEGPIGQEFNKNLQEKIGVRWITNFIYGKRHITTTDIPVRTPSDLDGVKLRCPDDPISIEYVTAMGASPTPMTFSELYLGLKQGIVVGQENPIATIISSKFQEVQKYLILTGHVTNTVQVLMNNAKWESLTSEHKDILDRCFKEGAAVANYLVKRMEKEGLKTWKEAGGIVIEDPDVEAFKKKVCDKIYYDVMKDKWPIELYERIQAIE